MPKAKKSLSQNFLTDKNICKKIIDLTNIKNKEIIEIGPGYGFLTDFIIKQQPKKIILIEKDNEIFNFLTKKYEKIKNITIINKDVLRHDFKNYKNIIIIANLPYNISTKIILKLFKNHDYINEMIFMIQKEVAIKFDYNVGKLNKYKLLNKICCNYKKCFIVPSTVFKPKPKVESMIVKFILKKNLNIDWLKLEDFIKKIFKNKRKKISNNIKINSNPELSLLKKRIDEININDLLYIYNFF